MYLAERILHHVRCAALDPQVVVELAVGNDQQIDAKPLEQASKRVEVTAVRRAQVVKETANWQAHRHRPRPF